MIRNISRRILEGLSFEIDEAADGRQAIDACVQRMPDLVVLDWSMPVMDGYDFLKTLRAMPDRKKPKVVFCTTENDVAHIARAIHAGADEYIIKPFDREILTAKMQQVGFA